MIHIAIVENEKEDSEALANSLQDFAKEHCYDLQIAQFSNAVVFLEGYKANYDVIFMDIQMPYLNGMDAARKLRELDDQTLLIFVTSFAKFAVEGYSVNAFDYILKPVKKSELHLKLVRLFRKLNERVSDRFILNTKEKKIKISYSDLLYVESDKHSVIYHTKNGNYICYKTFKNAEAELKKSNRNFVRCNNCYLVNLDEVTFIRDFTAYIGDEALQISHSKKKSFTEAFCALHSKTDQV